MPKYTRADLAAKYKRFCEGSNPRPLQFAAEVLHRVGAVDDAGRPHVTDQGLPTLKREGRKDRPEDFDLHVLTEAVLGPDWRATLGLDTQGSAFPVRKWLSEESVAGVPAQTFLNVSAWSATVAGLLGAKTLEGYESAEFKLRTLFPTENATVWGGIKLTDVIGPMEPAREVGQAEAHPSLRMDELWVQSGPLKKYGFKILITKETAFADITGGRVMAKAQEGGSTLAYRDNELAIDVLTGSTNNFNLGKTGDTAPTGYNTYSTAAYNGTSSLYLNDHVNPLADWTSFQAIDNVLYDMRHPVTGVPINVTGRTLIVPSTLETYANLLLSASGFRVQNQPGAPTPTITTSTFPTGVTEADNPYRGRFQVVADRWLLERHLRATAQGGLGLSATNARRYYAGDPSKFARRIVGWEANTVAVNPSDFVMADQGIVAGQVGNIALMYQVTSPYHMVRNKVA